MRTHYELTRSQFLFSICSIVAAFVLLAALAVRIVMLVDLWSWWTVPALLAGVVAADFGSGIVHWAADTWGRDDLPIIGRRLLVPFRVHHINPDDFLRRRFVDTNGDVAFIAALVLSAQFLVPLETEWGAAIAVFGFAFCGIGMMTNQIHQWAHMPAPPPLVGRLQDCGVLLGRSAHAAHHDYPYAVHYCITTGWCNRVLDRVRFFSTCEAVVTALTGVEPREDDRRYEARYG
jgi:ubiquitin-conjugating enzyme E2 variant